MKREIFSTTGLPETLGPDATRNLGARSEKNLLALILANIAGLARSVAVVASTAFARPADTTAYASGDLVANNVTAGSVVPVTLALSRAKGLSGVIRRVRLKKSGAVLTLAQFRVHFYKSAPTVTNGDNGAWVSISAGYMGAADVTIDRAHSAGASGIGIPVIGTGIAFAPLNTTRDVYALIEARAAYVPASAETFTIEAEVEQG